MTTPGTGDPRTHTPIPGLVQAEAPGAEGPGVSPSRPWQAWSPDLTPPDFAPRRQEIAGSDRVGAAEHLDARAGTWTMSVISGRIAASWVDRRPGQGFGRVVETDMATGCTAVVPAGVALSYQVLDAPVHLSMLLDARCDHDNTGEADAPYRILFVCTANICRSAYADIAANARPHAGLEFASAGVHALVGRSIDPPMADCLDASLDASTHHAHQLTRADMAAADLVLTMAAEHRRYILEEWPDLGRKAFVLGHATRELQRIPDDLQLSRLAGHLWRRRTVEPDDDVPDPYGRGPAAARAAARKIDANLDIVLAALGRLRASGPGAR